MRGPVDLVATVLARCCDEECIEPGDGQAPCPPADHQHEAEEVVAALKAAGFITAPEADYPSLAEGVAAFESARLTDWTNIDRSTR